MHACRTPIVALALLAGLLGSQAFAQGGIWTTKAPMPTARSGVASAAANGQLYVISGENTSVVEAYAPLTDSWVTKAPILTNRAYAQAGEINGKIYVVGGCTNSDCRVGVTNVLEQYDPASNTWTSMAPMWTLAIMDC